MTNSTKPTLKITFFYSAAEQAIIAVLGDTLELGDLAFTTIGTGTAGTLPDVEPMVVVEDIIRQFRVAPQSAVSMYFLTHGGLITECDSSSFEKLSEVEL